MHLVSRKMELLEGPGMESINHPKTVYQYSVLLLRAFVLALSILGVESAECLASLIASLASSEPRARQSNYPTYLSDV